MAPALCRGFLLPFDDICNIGELVILSETVEKVQKQRF
jgi:sporulation protein YlmC with PRC-barrel domain